MRWSLRNRAAKRAGTATGKEQALVRVRIEWRAARVGGSHGGAVPEHEVGREERVLLEQLEAQVVARVARRQERPQRGALDVQLAAVAQMLPPELLLLRLRLRARQANQ